MRSIYSVIFLILMVLPFVGAWIWLEGRMHAARYDARIAMSATDQEESLVLWKFTQQEVNTVLRWEHDREFEYDGEMYDVVRSEAHGDTTWYWCHHDRKETKVRKALASFVAAWMGAGPQQQQDQQRLFDFFKSLYSSNAPQVAHLLPDIGPIPAVPFTGQLLEIAASPDAPPPRSV